MPVYLLSCELKGPSQSYGPFRAELERIGAKPVLASQWVFRVSGPASGIRDRLKTFVPPGDRLVVVQVDGTEWATSNPVTPIRTVMAGDESHR